MMRGVFVIINVIMLTLAQISPLFILPPFRQISHDIQSGPIEVRSNDTIYISKFYFDGKAPSAHFWVGKGEPSSNGTLVPHEYDTGTLPLLSNVHITLKLKNLTINDIDYISVWCKVFNSSLGHVFTNERWLHDDNGTDLIIPKTIGPFRKTQHGVSSGNIILVNESKILVPNFNYDGSGAAQFWVGKGTPSPSGKLALKENSPNEAILPKHVNQNITVVLPDQFSLIDFDYLAVWDGHNSSFGEVFFRDSPNTMEMYIGTQYEGFENQQYGLKSGPIIVVNKNTLYVTHFRYRGFGNEYFWASPAHKQNQGFLVPNQNGIEDVIEEDQGSSFYLELPPNLLLEKEIIFGIWDNRTKAFLEHLNFAKNSDALNFEVDVSAQVTKDGKRIIRYPKCCPHGKMLTGRGCVPTDLILDNSIPVHYANSTHLNDDPMVPDRVLYVPYLNNLTCPKYFLNPKDDDDKFLYLTSGTLLFPGNQDHYFQDNFCLDIIEINSTASHVAFICYKSSGIEEGIRIAVCVCVFLSAVCLLFTAATFLIVSDRDDMRGASIVGFSGFMGIAFLFLFFTQVGLESETVCNVLGYFFQFFIVSSLICLDALCFEMYYNIKYFDDSSILDDYKKRFTWYLSLALSLPLLFVIISVAFNIPVGLININLDKNCLLDVSKKKWLLYSPILLTVLIAIALTIYNYKLYYCTDDEMSRTEGRRGHIWLTTRSDVKTRLMLCVFLVAFTGLCWIFEIITYAFESPWEPLDILHALQGVFTMIIVLSTGQIWKRLVSRTCRRKPRSYSNNRNATELEPMNNNGNATS